jgi:uncharacterized membrane protein YhaH (DUF805 family)
MDLGSLLFSFSGRINRAKYWLAVLIYLGVAVVLGIVLFAGFHAGLAGIGVVFGLIAIAVYIAMLVSGLAVAIKRLHDRDKSGWWVLVFYVVPGVLGGIGSEMGAASGSDAIVGLFGLVSLGISVWAFVELGCLRGTVGPNNYGPDPLELKA